jgi:hypothetical protein
MGDDNLQICSSDASVYYDSRALICRLPAHDERQAADFLEVLGTGGALGTGYKWNRLGVDLPQIRGDYEQAVRALVEEVEVRRATMTIEDLARWASAERLSIARAMRIRQGLGTVVLLEARDNFVYGLGGRTFPNLQRRYLKRGFRGPRVYEEIVRGATHPNTEISAAAMRGARFLKYGGRAVLVVSVVTTGYTLLTTPTEDLPRVLSEEAGGFLGGTLGTEAAIGLCLVFGIVTGGWGLLACGVIGGLAGGIIGTEIGNRLYYATSDDEVVFQAEDDALIDMELLSESMPPMCW